MATAVVSLTPIFIGFPFVTSGSEEPPLAAQ